MQFFKLVTHMISPRPRFKTLGRGQLAAQRRERAQRRAYLMSPDHSVYTRQQRRADERRTMKELRSLRKVHAMKYGEPGGSAVIV